MRTKHDPTLSYVGNVIDFGEHSNNEIQRAVLPRTESGYIDKLLLFDKFVKLHPQAVIPPDIRTCRAFLEWIAKGMNGRIEERPTVETIKGFFRQFATGMKRERNFDFPEASRTTINEYIVGELKAKIPLSTAQMNKDGGVSPNDLTILMTQLWCRDHHEYRGNPTDRARVQLSAAMLLYCFTSARTGEVHESTARRKKAQDIGVDSEDAELEARVLAACYKHFELTVETVDGMIMLVLTYQREFVKGYWRKEKWAIPKHAFYEVYAEDVPIFLNFLTFFLPMASADNAFRNYGSVNEILDAVEMYERVGPLENKILEVIHVREEMKEMPVFRQYLEHNVDHFKGHARGADAFGKALVHLGHRSGYTLNITVRACRRWALQEADKTHSETARMKFAGQTNRDTYGRSYAHPLSEVDGPANYLGIATRQEHIQNRRGMGLYRNSSLSQLLPAKAEYEFFAREDICHLDQIMANLSLQLSGATSEEKHKIQLQQKKIYNEKRGLYNKELRKVERQSGKPHGSIYTETMFHYRRRVMPHRDFLASALLCKVSLRSSDGRRTLQALESLCSETHTVSYRDSLSPLDQACLCGKSIEEFKDHRKWLHLYRCYSSHYKSTHGFAQMCFECDLWFTNGSEWENHCEVHLDNPGDLLRCDPITFRNALIKPGLCPFCLGANGEKPSKRMSQFVLSPPQWHSHIENHLKNIGSDFDCKHPACCTSFGSLEELTYHLVDMHCWRPRRQSPKKRKWADIKV